MCRAVGLMMAALMTMLSHCLIQTNPLFRMRKKEREKVKERKRIWNKIKIEQFIRDFEDVQFFWYFQSEMALQ